MTQGHHSIPEERDSRTEDQFGPVSSSMLTPPGDLCPVSNPVGPTESGSVIEPVWVKPGQIVFDKYLVLGLLGRGGMGTVWLVRHRELEVERALKLIVSGIMTDENSQARLKREARVMALFSHPNAVAVHDARITSEAAFIEMEYIRGKPISSLLEPGNPMPLDWSARILVQLGAVLQEAHDRGIIHRDLKPSNLMLLDGYPPGQEHLKVLDFGIAKLLGTDAAEVDDIETGTGVFLGTALYASPDQQMYGSVDGRSDLYSVGVTLYEFLTGYRPFAGPRAVFDHIHTPPPPFAEKNPLVRVPRAVERVVMRCLAKDPADRPQSARDLVEEFHKAMASGGLPRLEAEPSVLTVGLGETKNLALVVNQDGRSDPIEVEFELGPAGLVLPANLVIPTGTNRVDVTIGAELDCEIGDSQVQVLGRCRSDDVVCRSTLTIQVIDSASAHFRRGVIHREDDEPDEAMNEFRRTLHLDPTHQRAHYYLGKGYHALRDYDEAVSHYDAAFRHGLIDADAYVDRGNAYYDRREYQPAIDNYTMAIQIDQACALAFERRAAAHARLGHHDLSQEDRLLGEQIRMGRDRSRPFRPA